MRNNEKTISCIISWNQCWQPDQTIQQWIVHYVHVAQTPTFGRIWVYFHNLAIFSLNTCVLKINNWFSIAHTTVVSWRQSEHEATTFPPCTNKTCSVLMQAFLVLGTSWAMMGFCHDILLWRSTGIEAEHFGIKDSHSDLVDQRYGCYSWPWHKIVSLGQFSGALRFSKTWSSHREFMKHNYLDYSML